jgi:hypothetical protein
MFPEERRMKLSMLEPRHPERVCWGCEKLCPASDLACGNGSERTPHPVELFGENWRDQRPDLAGCDTDSRQD